MVRKFLAIGILLLIIPMILAMEVVKTPLTINADPNYDLEIRVIDSATGNLVQPFSKNTGSSGQVKLDISSLNVEEVNIEVVVFKDFIQVSEEASGPHPVGSPISMDISINEKEPVEEIPENITEEEPAEEQLAEEEAGVTGKTIGDTVSKIFSKTNLLYAGIVIVTLVIVLFVTRVIRARNLIPRSIIVRKQSELLREKKEEDEESGELREAHKKLREAQAEINKLKNRKKIEEMENQIQEEKERLERMRRGEE